MLRFLSGIFFLCIVSGFRLVYGQTFELRASSTTIAANEPLTLEYRFDGGNLPTNLLPDVNGMLVIAGPSSFSSSYQSGNNPPVQVFEVSYEVLFSNPGTYTIPPVTIKTRNTKYKCNALTITVTKGKKLPPLIPPGYEGKELVIVMEPSKTKVSVGECVGVNMVVYSVYGNVSLQDITYPTFDGGWVQDAKDAVKGQFENGSYKGKPYLRGIIRKIWMIPGVTGTVIFDPVKASLIAQTDDPVRGILQIPYEVESAPVQFNVEELPAKNKPELFTNAIGDFTFSIMLDRLTARVNESIKATVKVEGIGNFPIMTGPILDLLDAFEVFEPKEKNEFEVTVDGIRGKKFFEYMIIPRKEGDFTLGPFRFYHYSPDQKKYIETLGDSFQVRIQGVVTDTTHAVAVNNGSFDGSDVSKLRPFFFGGIPYFAVWCTIFVIGLVFIIYRKKIFFTKKDDTQKKLRLAEERAEQQLKNIHVSSGDTGSPLPLLTDVYFTYLTDKFQINKNQVTRTLLQEKISDTHMVVLAVRIMDLLDQFRYAPAATSDLQRVKELINELVQYGGKI